MRMCRILQNKNNFIPKRKKRSVSEKQATSSSTILIFQATNHLSSLSPVLAKSEKDATKQKQKEKQNDPEEACSFFLLMGGSARIIDWSSSCHTNDGFVSDMSRNGSLFEKFQCI
jgi:hypothetical protein